MLWILYLIIFFSIIISLTHKYTDSNPPPALSREVLRERIEAGARLFKDIDPDFVRWYNESQFALKLYRFAIVANGILMIALVFIFLSGMIYVG